MRQIQKDHPVLFGELGCRHWIWSVSAIFASLLTRRASRTVIEPIAAPDEFRQYVFCRRSELKIFHMQDFTGIARSHQLGN